MADGSGIMSIQKMCTESFVSVEGVVILFFLFALPSISGGSLIAFWLYEKHRQTLQNARAMVSTIFLVFVIGYTLSTLGGIWLLWVIDLYLLAGLLAVLMSLSIREGRYPNFLIGIGGAICFISLISIFLTIFLSFSVPEAFLSGELEMSTRFEAFYRYYLPWLFRISALLAYGIFSGTVGYVLKERNLDNFHTLLKIESGIFLFFISSEVIHSFIFGRRIGT